MDQIIQALTSNAGHIIGGVILGFSVGILTGLFGAGGGIILTPLLNIMMGLSMPVAAGTSICQLVAASSSSLYHHFDKRLMGVRVAFVAGLGIPFGTVAGIWAMEHLKKMPPTTVLGRSLNSGDLILLSVFSILLSLVAIWLFIDNFILQNRDESGRDDDDSEHAGLLAFIRIPPIVKFRTVPADKFSAPVLVAIGLFIGFLGALLGIGGGVILLPALFYLVGQQTKYAIRTSMMIVFVAGVFSLINHAVAGNINYILAVSLAFGAFFGTKTGTILQNRTSSRSIRKYFGFVVVAAAALVISKLACMLFR